MADALDSGSSGSNPVRVQVPFSAWIEKSGNPLFFKGFRSFFIIFTPVRFDYLFAVLCFELRDSASGTLTPGTVALAANLHFARLHIPQSVLFNRKKFLNFS